MRNSIPENWTQSTLEGVATIIMGQSPPSKYYNTEGDGLPFFQGKAEFGAFYPEAVKWCTQPGKVAEKDDILISVRAPVGPTNLAPSECCIGRGLAAIRPSGYIPSKYLLYYLRSIENEIESFGIGTTFKAISGKILKSLSVPVAPFEQQKRIVAEIEKQFSRLDEAVANLKRVKANLKRYKAAVLKAAVEGKLTEEWRKEHPDVEPASKLLKSILAERRNIWEETELAKMKAKGKVPKDDTWKKKYKEPYAFEADNLPILTDSWIWVSLDQLLSLLRNGISKKPAEEKGLAILRISAVRPLLVSVNDIRFLPEYLLAEYKDFVLKEDDLLFTRYNGNPPLVGVCGRMPRTTVPTVHPDKLIRGIVVSDQLISPAYLEIAVNSGMSREFIARRVRTTAGQSGISGGDLKQVPIPLPSFKEQLGIVAEVDFLIGTLKKTMKEIDKQLKRAERLRQSILSKAFSGRLLQISGKNENKE